MTARHTRAPRPSPRRDWWALARRDEPLPAVLGGAPGGTSPDGVDGTRQAVPDGPDEHGASDALADDALELRVRARPDGVRVATLVGALATDDPAVLRRLGDRLHDAADALAGGVP